MRRRYCALHVVVSQLTIHVARAPWLTCVLILPITCPIRTGRFVHCRRPIRFWHESKRKVHPNLGAA